LGDANARDVVGGAKGSSTSTRFSDAGEDRRAYFPRITPLPGASLGTENDSRGKVHRHEPRCTFPNEMQSLRLVSRVMTYVEAFTADTFFTLAQTIDLTTPT
jgi:hypothetical protein